jgi:hypothetical protein
MGGNAAAVKRLLHQAMENAQARRFGEAGQVFLRALDLIESAPVSAERAGLSGLLGDLCSRTGHPDLALMVLRDVPDPVAWQGDPTEYCGFLLTLANSWGQLARADAAAAVNAKALLYALEHERLADAASANTNLAVHDANSGRLSDALERLQTSLQYLARSDGNPDTDTVTRLMLLQVADALDGDPEPALQASADLFTRLQRSFGPDRWQQVAPAFHRLVERFLAAHPELDAQAWKRKTFPRVFGDGA